MVEAVPSVSVCVCVCVCVFPMHPPSEQLGVVWSSISICLPWHAFQLSKRTECRVTETTQQSRDTPPRRPPVLVGSPRSSSRRREPMLLSAILMLPAAVETCPKWCSSWQCDGSMWCSSGKIPAPCRKRCQQEGSSADVTGPHVVAVFKTARSGSTWFASLLQSTLHLTMDHEIVHYHEVEKLVAFLASEPGWAIGSSLTAKMRAQLLQGGSLTVNPKNTPCVNWTNVVAGVPRVHVVAFERCNTVKHAISYLRTPAVAKACGGVKSKNCTTKPAPQAFNASEFRNAIVCAYERSALAQHAAASTGLPVNNVTYESLQRDQVGVLTRFARAGLGSLTSRRALTAKTGSDDVSSLVLNPGELRKVLELHPCLLEQWDDLAAGRCLRCPNPWPEVKCDRQRFQQYALKAPALSFEDCSAHSDTFRHGLKLEV